jgi:putative transposase
MKLIAQLKLHPSGEQAKALRATLQTANAACNYISDVAWRAQSFRKYSLQKLCYYETKERFHLSAQVVIRCLAKVAAAYELDRKVKRRFKEAGGMAYDDRILSWNLGLQRVSIWTVAGRQAIPFQAGPWQLERLKTRQGETDLICRQGQWFLLAVCNVDEPEPIRTDGALGVDLGVMNIATDSDGETYSGAEIERVRQKREFQRGQLQRKGTKSAKRRLRKLAGKQATFQKVVNHTIAKAIVQKAQRTGREIRLEDLTGIRERIRARGREHRARLSNWSFAQLGAFVAYKAALAGVPVVYVAPAYTSQRCSRCGHTAKSNRRSQGVFECRQCSHFLNADLNAALNIREGEVTRPHASEKAAA